MDEPKVALDLLEAIIFPSVEVCCVVRIAVSPLVDETTTDVVTGAKVDEPMVV